jgi:iron complex outermembrane recepter protein
MPRYCCRPRLRALSGLVAVHALLAIAPVAHTDDKTVIVIGTRASLASAQMLKRDSLEMVDSVVASDVIRLPDFGVADALQRVPGIQIARERGDGSLVTIRGLTQMESMLNSRELFTAGPGRNLDFADIPSEMVSRIDVHKASSAALIEGGLGGVIDLRTRRPLDLERNELVASARLVYGDLVDDVRPQFSTLASAHWRSDAFGEIGALINVSYQERAWREDQKGTGNPVVRSDVIPGRRLNVPNGTSESISFGDRKRSAFSTVLQWQPAESLELYAEAMYAEFETLQDTHQINVLPSAAFVPGSAAVFDGTDDMERITWVDSQVAVLAFARDTLDRTRQAAIGGNWRRDAVTISADVSYTDSRNELLFSGLTLASTAANFTHDLATDIPSSFIAGSDMLDPANYRFAGVSYRSRIFEGDLTALRIDGEYRLSSKFLRAVAGGIRYAEREANNAPGLIFADVALSAVPATGKSGFVIPNPHTDFFKNEYAPSVRYFLSGDLDLARNPVALRGAFGVTSPIPATASAVSIWHIDESTSAAYVMAEIGLPNLPIDGNIGLRVVQTDESVASARTVPGTATVVPIALGSSYTDYLPSMNLRWELREGLYVRAAASKTITRPNFDQLSPSLVLTPNPVTPALNQGSAGNPALQPARSKNADLALERYFSPTTLVYLGAYLKNVDGFVTTVSSPEVHDGLTYQISRPRNTTAAKIRGGEAGYQQFFDALPGWLGGLGVQVNYTYVYSRTPDRALGNVPLQNLSRHSYNVIGMYERGPISARLAYNWRDKFLSGIVNLVGVGSLPVYTDSYGWVDGSFTYQLGRKASISLEGLNLTRTVRASHYGGRTRPQNHWLNDRQVSLTATMRF